MKSLFAFYPPHLFRLKYAWLTQKSKSTSDDKVSLLKYSDSDTELIDGQPNIAGPRNYGLPGLYLAVIWDYELSRIKLGALLCHLNYPHETW